MKAAEFAKRTKELMTQAEVNSRKHSRTRQGAQWRIVADLMDRVSSSAVLKNLQNPDKNNQPPQY
jgi:hypothetical protein